MKIFKKLIVLWALLFLDLVSGINIKLFGINEKEFDKTRRISSCTEAAVNILFKPWVDICIIASKGSSFDSELKDEIVKRIAGNRTVKLINDFRKRTYAEHKSLLAHSSFLLMDEELNVRRILEHSSIDPNSEYIVITDASTKWITDFSKYLWNQLGFARIAFVRPEENGGITLLRLTRDPKTRRGSQPILKSYENCDKRLKLVGPEEKMINNTIAIHPFSSWQHLPTQSTLKFARILEATEKTMDSAKIDSTGNITSFGVELLQIFTSKNDIQLIRDEWQNENERFWIDGFNEVMSGKLTFFYTVLPAPSTANLDLVEPAAWYKYETLVFVDSPRKPTLQMWIFLVPYHTTIWILTLVLYGIFGAFAWAIDSLWHHGFVRERIGILSIWAISLDQGVKILPKKFGLRFVVGMWIIRTVLINSGYTARFSSSLIAAEDKYLLRTFKDVLKSEKPICCDAVTSKFLNDTDYPVMHAIYNKLKIVQPDEIFNAVLNKDHIGIRHLTKVKRHNWLNRANRSTRLHGLTEATILNYPSCFFARKHHPFNNEFSKMISRLRETGILNKLENNYATGKMTRQNEVSFFSSDDSILTIRHFSAAFQILGVGLIISCVVFFIEMKKQRSFLKKLLKITKK